MKHNNWLFFFKERFLVRNENLSFFPCPKSCHSSPILDLIVLLGLNLNITFITCSMMNMAMASYLKKQFGLLGHVSFILVLQMHMFWGVIIDPSHTWCCRELCCLLFAPSFSLWKYLKLFLHNVALTDATTSPVSGPQICWRTLQNAIYTCSSSGCKSLLIKAGSFREPSSFHVWR